MKNLNPIHQTPEEKLAASSEASASLLGVASQSLDEIKKNTAPKEVQKMKFDQPNKEIANAFFSMLKGDPGESIKGDTGDKGEKGDKGDVGQMGFTGMKGDRGEKGDKGDAGLTGKDGLSIAGKDGSPDTGEVIVEKLNPLKNVLDFQVLKNIPDFVQQKDMPHGQGGGGGGSIINFRDSTGTKISAYVSDIQFGTGITPTYSNGKITLTGTASGAGDVVGPASSTDNAIVRFDGTTGKLIQDSALFTYSPTHASPVSGPRLVVGTGATTSQGWIFGYGDSSNRSGLWKTSPTPDSNNYTILTVGNDVYWNTGTVTSVHHFMLNNATQVATMGGTAGIGLTLTPGTATTDVAALSLTRTNNNAAVATGVKIAFTDTTSAVGFLPFQLLGGASATANLLSVSKTGVLSSTNGVDSWSITNSNSYTTSFTAAYTLDLSAGGGSVVQISSPLASGGFMSLGYNGIRWGRDRGAVTLSFDTILDTSTTPTISISSASAYSAAVTYLNGGALGLTAGAGASGSAGLATGGAVNITAGIGYGTGAGGNIVLTPGTAAGSGAAGIVTIGGGGTLQLTTIELGAASDTTLSRSSAGVLAVEGVVIPSISSTNTLTNKRHTPRVYTATNNASLTPEIDTYDVFHLTAMSAATTINNHSTSTPADGELMRIRFLDNGTARALTWGSNYVAKAGVALPTTTTLSKNLVVLFEWNANLSKFNLLASGLEA